MEDAPIIAPAPPSPIRVAQRALILSAISCRGIIDSGLDDVEDKKSLAGKLCEWLFTLGCEMEMSEWEKRILDAPFGSLSTKDRINASWLSEAATVLAWALRKHALPGFSTQCDPAASANSLGFLCDAKSTALSNPILRTVDELGEYNEFIYNVHWRVRDFSLNRRSYDFESLAKKAWGEPVLRHGLKLLEKDLCVDGVPISHAEERSWRPVASITSERHRASNWLIGYDSEDFYEVGTDT